MTRRPTRASSPTPTAPRCSSCRSSWRCATRRAWSASSSTRTSPSAAPATRRSRSWRRRSRRTSRASHHGHGLPPPHRLQRAAADRRLPRRRLHQGGVEGHRREPQDPAPAGPARLLHGRARAGLHRPLGGGPRRAARAAEPRPGARALRGHARRHRRRRAGRLTAIRWRPTPPAATRSSSAGSARTCRSPTAVASPSGSSRTTCARAPPRTPSRSPSWSPPATGWRRPRAGPGGPRDARGATRSSRGHRERGPWLHTLPAGDGTHAGRAGRGSPGHGGRLRRRGARPERGRAGPAVRGRRRRAPRPSCWRSIGWRREEVFITNVVKCRPPGNRDPEPDEMAACAPVPAPAAGGPRPGARGDPGPLLAAARSCRARASAQAHGTARPVDPATGAPRCVRATRCTTPRRRSARPLTETMQRGHGRLPEALIAPRPPGDHARPATADRPGRTPRRRRRSPIELAAITAQVG